MGTIVCVLASALALIVAAWQEWQTWRFGQDAIAVTGHVVAAPGQTGSMSSAHPLIEFPTRAGATVRYRQNGMGARPVGTPVRLLYRPSAPAATAIVAGFWTRWFSILAPLVLGIALLALPFLSFGIGLRSARP